MGEHRITRLGLQGDGIADGPVYAPLTLPGEVVRGTLEGQTLKDVAILSPSEDRVRPPCRHFKACGGCQLQHGADALVAAWKQDVVRFALEAQGVAAEMRPILTSPPRSRRRATFAARRTKKGALAGFHGRGSDVIIEVPECQLLLPEVLTGRAVAERLALAGASRKGALAVNVTVSEDGLDVAASGGKPLDGPLQQGLAHLCDQLGLARLSWDGDVIAMRSPPMQRFGRARVAPPPGAFLQATREGEAALLASVRDALGGAGAIVDLFAGCGTFSLPLAEEAAVHAVEGDAAMLEALDKGWRNAPGLKPVTTEARDLFRRPLLPDELKRFDAALIDPPRAGAEAQVAELIAAKLPVIAYVSCNPVTFARDARSLTEGGYALDWVQVVDQFRWSAHIELAARFSRDA